MSWMNIIKISDYEKEVGREFASDEMPREHSKTHQQKQLEVQENLVRFAYANIKSLPVVEDYDELDSAEEGLYNFPNAHGNENIYAVSNRGKVESIMYGQKHEPNWILKLLHLFKERLQ